MSVSNILRGVVCAVLLLCAVPVAAQQGVLKNAAVTATGSANAVEASLTGIEGVSVTVVNSGTYQLEFEGWTGQSWAAYPGIQLSDFSRDTSTTGTGTWFFGNLGFGRIRVRASSYTSGAPNITIVRGFGNVNAPYSAGSISGGNDAASATGAAVPSSASYTGLNIGGNLVGQTGFTVGSSNGAAVAIIDGSGNQITSFGGGTQFAEDAAHSSGATGTMSLGVRTDSVAALAGATGDYQPFIFNSVGRLWTTATIDAALPAGTNNIGDVDIVSGTITTVSTVTNVATIGTSVTPGTAAANLGKAEDAVAASGDTGVSMLAVAEASPSATAANGDYIQPKTDANGRLWANAMNAGTFVVQENGAALTALQLIDNIPITIGSTTSGQSGALVMGAVTTAAPTYTTAQSAPLSLTTAGLLRVAIEAGAGSGGTAVADDADFIAGTTSFTPFGGFYQSTVTACTDGDACTARITAGRAVTVALTNPDGTAATYATDVVEDAAETAGGSGPMVLSVRRDTAASSAGTTGDNATFNTDATGRLWVNPSHNGVEDAAETAGGDLAMAGSVRRDTLASSAGASGDNATFNTSAVGALYTQPSAGTNGGCTPGSSISAGAVLETQIKATAGQLYSITVTAIDATPVFLKIYNDTGANVDETDTPVQRFVVPSAATGGGITTTWNVGMAFSTAITFRVTTGAADNDTGALTANEVLVSYCYL